MKRKPPSVRANAALILQRVEEGGFSHLLVRHSAERWPEPADRALLRELVGGTLRWRGRLDFLLNRYSRKPLQSLQPELLQHLRLGLYQLLFLQRIPDWAVVNETVEAVRGGCGMGVVSYANGVLRAAARDRGHYPEPRRDPAKPHRFIAHRYSLPLWLAQRWVEQFGADDAAKLAAASAARPAVFFRVTLMEGRDPVDEDVVIGRLAEEGVECRAHPLFPSTWEVVAGNLGRSKTFTEGLVMIQDPASQVIPLLTGLETGEWALDCCAAPGAKTVRLAELTGPQGRVVATDLHPGRLGLVAQNVERTGCPWVLPLACDMGGGPTLKRKFDAVLVDAPCTGTGTLRRHPEIRWRLRPVAPMEMGETQLRILRGSARLVAKSGCLVYSVCSVETEEGPGVVERFLPGSGFHLERAVSLLPSELSHLEAPDGTIRSLPHRDGCDGFFAARLIRGV